MAVMRACRACGTPNPSTYANCTGCGELLAGSPVAVPREREPSWGQELVERARGRAEPMVPCLSCGARNPVRFVRCQTCRGATKAIELPPQVRCPSCDGWNRSRSQFCELCGDALADAGAPARWRPEGCPGCADLVAQPGLRFCGTCGCALPTTWIERRELLQDLVARRVGGGYRNQAPPPELNAARCELVLRDEATVLWASLVDSPLGVVDLDLVSQPRHASTEAAPPASGSLVRLARWVRHRLGAVAPRVSEAQARIEAFCTEDEQVVEAEAVGSALRVRVAFRAAPAVKRLEAWLGDAMTWSAAAADPPSVE